MTEDKSDWIYCRLVDCGRFVFPRNSFWFGSFEFCSDSEPNEKCRSSLSESMAAFAIKEVLASETGSELGPHLTRARTIIVNKSAADATRDGELSVKETMRMLNNYVAQLPIAARLLSAGFLYDLKHHWSFPLLPPMPKYDPLGMIFMADETSHHPQEILTMLLASPKHFGELGVGIKRSAYWYELAESAEDECQRLLLYWMASECLAKVNESENIGPKLLAAIGFPKGNYFRSLPQVEKVAIASTSDFKVWQKKLTAVFEHVRSSRNGIVHAGFRQIDLHETLSSDELLMLPKLLPWTARCMNEIAIVALARGQRTIKNLWPLYSSYLGPLGAAQLAQRTIDRLSDSSFG